MALGTLDPGDPRLDVLKIVVVVVLLVFVQFPVKIGRVVATAIGPATLSLSCSTHLNAKALLST